MRIQKFLAITVICLASSCPASALAQGGPSGDIPEGEQAPAVLDMTPVYDAMDNNRDGLVDRDEWLASGMTQDSYDRLFSQMLDTDKDGYLTREDILGAIPRFEVDADHNGKASIEEFVAANKKAAESMAAGGPGMGTGGVPQAGPSGGDLSSKAPSAGVAFKIEGAYQAVLTLPKASPTVILTFCPGGEPFQGAWLEDGGKKFVGEMTNRKFNRGEMSFRVQAGPGIWDFVCRIQGETLMGTVTGDGATSPFEGKRVALDDDYCSK